MSKGFRDLMVDLALDMELRQRFYQDKASVLSQYQLTDDEITALTEFDGKIEAYVTQENPPERLSVPTSETHAYVSVRIIVRPSVRSINRFLVMDNTSSDYHAFAPSLSKHQSPKPHLQSLFSDAVVGAPLDRFEKLLELTKAAEDNRNYEDVNQGPALLRPEGLADINIVGLGIAGVDQVTRETEHVLRNSSEVLYVGHGLGVKEYLTSLCPSVIDIAETSYVEGSDRIDAYRRMAAAVVDSALLKKPITFALYGHPLVFAYPPFLVRRIAALAGLTVRVLPGVSCVDSLFCDLWVDPAASGLLIYEASDVLISKRPFLPTVGAVVLQIGAVETALYSTDASKPERFDRFTQHLLKFYEPQHKIIAISCASYGMLAPDVLEFPISAMRDHATRLTSGFTLYIPPAEHPSDIDRDVAERMTSQAHLESLLEKRSAA